MPNHVKEKALTDYEGREYYKSFLKGDWFCLAKQHSVWRKRAEGSSEELDTEASQSFPAKSVSEAQMLCLKVVLLSPHMCWGVKLKDQININNMHVSLGLSVPQFLSLCMWLELISYTTQVETEPMVASTGKPKQKATQRIW